ncbi:glycoside hydrolase family 125 protein [Saccharopolyspora sp. K220]|uniref:glycoside hydrolase family 125 protein n=1 Tax=Saccharopolyspora soli TaxID=2926618 RepID=UPI001F562391|nr:glycoside hydrolase family 125 protein [Saccharopolyspora soli]
MTFQQAIDEHAARIAEVAGDPRAAVVFAAAMRRTLRDAMHRDADGSVFVITGDIPAMWLRDSTTQLTPYLRFVGEHPEIADLVAGVVRRQLRCIETDSYANAFNEEPNGRCYDPDDLDDNPWLWERKYEVDSLAYPVQLAHRLWAETGRDDIFDGRARSVLRTVVDQWVREQDHERCSPYRFERLGAKDTETLARGGLGSPVAWTGMTWCGFHPSDARTYGYNIPANLFARRVLGHIAEIATKVYCDSALAADAARLARQIEAGVHRHGVVEHPEFGAIFAYEVDGLGRQLLMDDANTPSLLSLPLHDPAFAADPVYQATRRFVLSPSNPYYFSGTAASEWAARTPRLGTSGRSPWPGRADQRGRGARENRAAPHAGDRRRNIGHARELPRGRPATLFAPVVLLSRLDVLRAGLGPGRGEHPVTSSAS